jgi:hypothetical protein
VIVDKDDSHFIFVFHSDHVNKQYNYINFKGKPLTNKEYLQYWGKFVFFGAAAELDVLAKKLDPYVEEKIIPCIKYDRMPVAALGLKECVMCVYCDNRQKDEVWKVLNEHGVRIKAWVFERETVEKWSSGGVNLEKWIAAHGLNEQDAEEVRESARQKFKEMFENEDAIFMGIAQ